MKKVTIWMLYTAHSMIEREVPDDFKFDTLDDVNDNILEELDNNIVEVTPMDWGFNETQES